MNSFCAPFVQCRSVLQCAAVSCSVLQRGAVCCSAPLYIGCLFLVPMQVCQVKYAWVCYLHVMLQVMCVLRHVRPVCDTHNYMRRTRMCYLSLSRCALWCHSDVISIWRLYLPGVEPGISRWSVGIFTNYAVSAFIKLHERTHGVVGKYTDLSLWNPGFDSREI